MTKKINSSISPPTAARPVTRAEIADDGLADMIKRIQETEKKDDVTGQEMPLPPKPKSERRGEELSTRLEMLGLRDLSELSSTN